MGLSPADLTACAGAGQLSNTTEANKLLPSNSRLLTKHSAWQLAACDTCECVDYNQVEYVTGTGLPAYVGEHHTPDCHSSCCSAAVYGLHADRC